MVSVPTVAVTFDPSMDVIWAVTVLDSSSLDSAEVSSEAVLAEDAESDEEPVLEQPLIRRDAVRVKHKMEARRLLFIQEAPFLFVTWPVCSV